MATSTIPMINGNKVLWTGAWYGGTGSIPLSEAISHQPHGVVLVFSAYANGEPANYDWQYHFVSKWHALNYGGTGVDFFLISFNLAANKYLYIFDTKIEGNASNTATMTGATSKIGLKNDYWVLRAVIGV